MADQKQISFQGVDSGVLSLVEKYRKAYSSLYGDVIGNARKFSEQSKEQLYFINEQTRGLEKRLGLLQQEKRVLVENYNQAIKLVHEQQRGGQITTTQAQQRIQDIRQGFGARQAAIQQEMPQLKESSQLLKQILDQLKLSSLNQIAQDKEGVKKQIDSVEKRIKAGEEVSDEERLQFAMMKDFLRKTEREAPKEDMFSAMVRAQVVTSLFQQAARIGGIVPQVRDENQLVGPIMGAMIKTAGGFATSLLSGIAKNMPGWLHAVTGGVFQATAETMEMGTQRTLQERQQLMIAENKLMAKTGRFVDFLETGGFNLGSHSLYRMGVSAVEGAQLAEQIATNVGRNDKMFQRTLNAVTLERAYNVDRGMIMHMFRDMRRTTSEMGVAENAQMILNAVPGLKDNTQRLSEYLEMQSNLIAQFAQGSRLVDRGVVAEMMGRFTQVDRVFQQDPRVMLDMMNRIQGGLAAPQGEWAQARSFAVLSQLMPGGTPFQLMEAQQRGMAQPGALAGTFKMLQQQGLRGEELGLGIMQMFGLPAWQARSLAQAFEKQPELFEGIGGTPEEIFEQAGLDISEMQQRARERTTSVEASAAYISNSFIEGVTKGLGAVMTVAGEKTVKVIFDFINDRFTEERKKLRREIEAQYQRK